MRGSGLPWSVQNAETVHLESIAASTWPEFSDGVLQDAAAGLRLAAFFGQPWGEALRLHAILADGSRKLFHWWITEVGDRYPSLTPELPQAHWFERELAEQWGVIPEGHPWLKPIRFHRCYRPGRDAWGRSSEAEVLPGVTDFYRVEGKEVHEVAVGPVHAGVIEPGHFRFQCHGEEVFHLEIALGYQHRGIERALIGGPDLRTIQLIETAAGDTTIGHGIAYVLAVESLSNLTPSAGAAAVRAVALELERLANHTGDLGALANDVGFLPTASYCGRLRGDFLNLTALLCGNRFGRRLLRPGGLGIRIATELWPILEERLEGIARDVEEAVQLLWRTPSVRARFENAGTMKAADCLALGLVGPVARACGVPRDARREFPFTPYSDEDWPISTHADGNVQSRAWVRWLEIETSLAMVRRQIAFLRQQGSSIEACSSQTPAFLSPLSGVVTMVEGWRGEICHVALTDREGRLASYKIVDPSFHNWMGLAIALRGQQISDFPLCNKSFNLSYCGHDL